MPQAHDATAERDRGERAAPVGVRGRSNGPWPWVLSALAGGIAGAVVVVGSGARLDAFATAAAVLFACLIGAAAYAAAGSHRRSAERRREVRRLEVEVDDLLARGGRLDGVGEDRAARDRAGRDLADLVAKLKRGEISPREFDEALDRELPEARRRAAAADTGR